jgi:hypothetical protein
VSDLDYQLGEFERDELQAVADEYDEWLRDVERAEIDRLTRDDGEST